MVDLLASLSAFLRKDSNLTTLTGGRIYTDRLPQSDDSAAVVFWTTAGTAWNHLGGQNRVNQATVQMDSYGRTRSEANQIAWAVNDLLDAYQGDLEGTLVLGIVIDNEPTSGTDRPEEGSDKYRFITSFDADVTYATTEG